MSKDYKAASERSDEAERLLISPFRKTKLKPCVLCGGRFSEWGNNPEPLAQKGQCCDNCNRTKVIPARLLQVMLHRTQKGDYHGE
jgi:hypothetical protein